MDNAEKHMNHNFQFTSITDQINAGSRFGSVENDGNLYTLQTETNKVEKLKRKRIRKRYRWI